MDEQQVRQIIRDELGDLLRSDKYLFQRHIQMFDGRNIQTGRTTGTKIGTSTLQKIGFYGVNPVTQPDLLTDPVTQGATYDQGDVNDIVSAVRGLIDRQQDLGLMNTS